MLHTKLFILIYRFKFGQHYFKRQLPANLTSTRWFKYDRDYLCVNLATSVLVIFEPPCIIPSANRQLPCTKNDVQLVADNNGYAPIHVGGSLYVDCLGNVLTLRTLHYRLANPEQRPVKLRNKVPEIVIPSSHQQMGFQKPS